MAILQHFQRLRRAAMGSFNFYEKSLSLIPFHASSLHPFSTIVPLNSIHSFYCEISEENQISITKPRCGYNGPRRSHRLNFQMGFCNSSISKLEKIKFYDEPATDDTTIFYVEVAAGEETPKSNSKKTSEDAENICRIISTRSNSSIESTLDGIGLKISPELVEDVLKKLNNAGILALAFFHWAERQQGFKHTTEIFHHLIEALGKIKQFRLIWNLVESMKVRGILTKKTFGLITRRYARARKIEEAIDAFEKMKTFGLQPELSDYNSLIDTISKSKHTEKAHQIYTDMKRRNRFSPDLKTYTILLEGCALDRNLSRLKSVYQEMINDGFEPDVVTYGILINVLCKAGKCNEAIKIFNEMEAINCKPSPHVYCTLINGLGSEKRLIEALNYFRLSKASGFPPEVPTYNAVVGSYCWVLRFEDAFRTVDEMRRVGIGPNARTYDIIIHHLIKSGKPEDAYRAFQRMGEEAECEPELSTYTTIVSMLCTIERVDMALKVWEQMRGRGVLPCMHMFSTLINGLCYDNRLDDACRYFQEMLDKGIRPSGQLFSNLKEALIQGGKNHLALDLGMKLDRLRKAPLNG